MNRNNKGYMLIEIIMAATIGIGIAIFVVALIIKIKNKNDDSVVDSLTTTDATIVTNKLMEYAIAEKEKFDCNKIELTGKTLKYDQKIINVFNDYIDIDASHINCSNENSELSILIPIDIAQIPSEDYDIKIAYKYVVGSLTYPYLKVQADNPTEYSKSKQANIIIGSTSGLLGGTYHIKYKWSVQPISCDDIDNNNSVTIRVNNNDKEVSSSKIEVKDGTGKGKIYACNIEPISDYSKANVLPQAIVSSDAYLDNTPPECSITNGLTADNSKWQVYFNKTSTKDADSGLLEYGISYSKDSPTYDNGTSDDENKRLLFGFDTYFYGYVKDKAGNEGTCYAYWSSPPPSSGGGGGGGGGGQSGCYMCWVTSRYVCCG